MTKRKKNRLLILKRSAPLIFICIVILMTCRAVLFNHYENIARDQDGGFLYELESALLDLRFKIRGQEKPATKVGILAIDEKAIQQFGRWPFSRRYYQQALKNLKEAGVRWVGFDVIFSEPETPSVSDAKKFIRRLEKSDYKTYKKDLNEAMLTLEGLEKSSPGDRSFAQGIEEFQNVIMGFFYMKSQFEVERSGMDENPFDGVDSMDSSAIEMILFPDDEYDLSRYSDSEFAVSGAVTNIPTIANAAEHFAFFSNEPDKDAIVRWASMLTIANGQLFPALSLKLAAEAMDRDIVVFFNEIGVEAISLINREDESDSVEIPVDFYGRGKILINHKGPGYQTFPHISLADAYTGNFSEKAKEFLPGSVLLLGATATGINDQRPSPFDPALDGVENHAAVADNIMSGQFMKRLPEQQEIEMNLVLAIGLIFSPILIISRALFSAFFAISFGVGYYYFDKHYWFEEGIWHYMAMPYIELLALFFTIFIYKFATEEREKRKVKGAFSRYLAPDVMEQVLEDPSSLALGGQRRELTVFFSDVRGFTTISEHLSPEKLSNLMNEYFTPMTGIILGSKGVLDKYIGDAIMAFWGAPLEREDHADVAAEASVAMLFALEVLQAEFSKRNYPWVDIGIGLNTGMMSVGNMGSGERFQYTVMGDSVNLGSRLEGITKNYGVRCIVSEYTVAKFQRPEQHIIRDLDDIQVKGKNEPVKIYELMRPDYLETPERLKEFIKIFEEARLHYRAQSWDAASKRFMDCIAIKADDGPSNVFLKRIVDMRSHDYIENWDGVTRFTSK